MASVVTAEVASLLYVNLCVSGLKVVLLLRIYLIIKVLERLLRASDQHVALSVWIVADFKVGKTVLRHLQRAG